MTTCAMSNQTWSVQRATYDACMSAVQRFLAVVQLTMLGRVSNLLIISAQSKVFAGGGGELCG